MYRFGVRYRISPISVALNRRQFYFCLVLQCSESSGGFIGVLNGPKSSVRYSFLNASNETPDRTKSKQKSEFLLKKCNHLGANRNSNTNIIYFISIISKNKWAFKTDIFTNIWNRNYWYEKTYLKKRTEIQPQLVEPKRFWSLFHTVLKKKITNKLDRENERTSFTTWIFAVF